MRQPEEMGWYAELGEDQEPRAVHGIKRLFPESVEITEAQAREISAQVRAREPKVEGSPPAAQSSTPPVDLEPIREALAKHAELIAEHAGLHDKHEKTFVEIKRKTAEAIAQMTDGIGEKQG